MCIKYSITAPFITSAPRVFLPDEVQLFLSGDHMYPYETDQDKIYYFLPPNLLNGDSSVKISR